MAQFGAGPVQPGGDILGPVAEVRIDGSEKRGKASRTVGARILLPVASGSWTKSIIQTSCDRSPAPILALSRRLGVLFLSFKPDSLQILQIRF